MRKSHQVTPRETKKEPQSIMSLLSFEETGSRAIGGMMEIANPSVYLVNAEPCRTDRG